MRPHGSYNREYTAAVVVYFEIFVVVYFEIVVVVYFKIVVVVTY